MLGCIQRCKSRSPRESNNSHLIDFEMHSQRFKIAHSGGRGQPRWGCYDVGAAAASLIVDYRRVPGRERLHIKAAVVQAQSRASMQKDYDVTAITDLAIEQADAIRRNEAALVNGYLRNRCLAGFLRGGELRRSERNGKQDDNDEKWNVAHIGGLYTDLEILVCSALHRAEERNPNRSIRPETGIARVGAHASILVMTLGKWATTPLVLARSRLHNPR